MRSATFAAAVLVAVCLVAMDTGAHPLHSEAIERLCELYLQDDPASSIQGNCSFFVAAGYLVFQLDAAAAAGREPRVLSGAFMLAQSTGSVADASGEQIADGAVWLADPSPGIVHMEPGVLAAWPNGYRLAVSGAPAAADVAASAVVQNTGDTIADVLSHYLEQGFLHVVPLGFDHILFVVGLFLLSPRLKPLLWQVSAFTLAHTVTLALGATGIVTIPARIVEPLIALSIVWVAVENLLTDRLHRWRIAVVFCFGLLHGFGFAEALREIGLGGPHFYSALLAFNAGVELGQLTVIALCFLAVGWTMHASYYHRRVTVPASCVIGLISSYWVLARTVLA